MPRIIDLIRIHLEGDVLPRKLPLPHILKNTQWSNEFETLMRNRLLMGAFRYETFKDKGEGGYDYAAEACRRLLLYFETLNTEFLVDAANYCLLEYEFGNPQRHYSPEDDSDHHAKRIK